MTWPQIPQTCAMCQANQSRLNRGCYKGYAEFWALGRHEPHGCPGFEPFWRVEQSELLAEIERHPRQLKMF